MPGFPRKRHSDPPVWCMVNLPIEGYVQIVDPKGASVNVSVAALRGSAVPLLEHLFDDDGSLLAKGER